MVTTTLLFRPGLATVATAWPLHEAQAAPPRDKELLPSMNQGADLAVRGVLPDHGPSAGIHQCYFALPGADEEGWSAHRGTSWHAGAQVLMSMDAASRVRNGVLSMPPDAAPDVYEY